MRSQLQLHLGLADPTSDTIFLCHRTHTRKLSLFLQFSPSIASRQIQSLSSSASLGPQKGLVILLLHIAFQPAMELLPWNLYASTMALGSAQWIGTAAATRSKDNGWLLRKRESSPASPAHGQKRKSQIPERGRTRGRETGEEKVKPKLGEEKGEEPAAQRPSNSPPASHFYLPTTSQHHIPFRVPTMLMMTASTSSACSLLLIVATIAVHLAGPADGCFASGICGGGCLPPPPPPCVPAQCGAGYGCGQYGCYRLRARVASSRTLKISSKDLDGFDGEEQQQRALDTPDQRFMACCQARQLPDGCLNKCSFAAFTRQALQNMYFRMDTCPMQAAADMQFCAAQGRDHRECCVRNGVATTLAGEKCLTFCNQIPGNQTQLDMSYLSCYDRFENMKGCFWHDLQRRLQQRRLHSQK